MLNELIPTLPLVEYWDISKAPTSMLNGADTELRTQALEGIFR